MGPTKSTRSRGAGVAGERAIARLVARADDDEPPALGRRDALDREAQPLALPVATDEERDEIACGDAQPLADLRARHRIRGEAAAIDAVGDHDDIVGAALPRVQPLELARDAAGDRHEPPRPPRREAKALGDRLIDADTAALNR